MENFDENTVILAIDFDGTICTEKYPEVGMERQGAKEFINKLYDEGYFIIINTCRTHDSSASVDPAQVAKDFLKLRGIKYHTFNEHAPFILDKYPIEARKISAEIYIDDRCLFDLPNWEQKYNIIKVKYPDPKDKTVKASLVQKVVTRSHSL